MPFEDEVREVIQKARADREKYEQEGRDFEVQWHALREALIWPLFHDAAKAFKEERITAHPELTNGSIVLQAGLIRGSESFRHVLKFQADGNKRVVICSSNFADSKDESFTLDHLTEAVIKTKVKQFADAVGRGDSPRPPLVF